MHFNFNKGIFLNKRQPMLIINRAHNVYPSLFTYNKTSELIPFFNLEILSFVHSQAV